MPELPPVDPIDAQAIVVTASRTEQVADNAIATVTLIDQERIDALGEPGVPAYLRFVPSVSVSTGGPAGSLTQVRIRGSEANHTLLFIDGIRANDPAAGNEPRFELLNADLASRIEVVRGPQSALWGSEAIGGVVAVSGAAPEGRAVAASVEGGSFGFRRASGALQAQQGYFGISLGLAGQESRGIDSFDGIGDRDGYSNLAMRGRLDWQPVSHLELGASGFLLKGTSEFDGFNPLPPFQRQDTLDHTRNRLAAGRLWASFGSKDSAWRGHVSASLLGSRNRNLLGNDDVNITRGQRSTVETQVERRWGTGAVTHQFIAAAGHSKEHFEADDVAFGGFSAQDRTRGQDWIVGEWRGLWRSRLVVDLAVRHDRFQRFQDATTFRTGATAAIGSGFSVAGSYAEGIAQPTFFDLYGFFPGSFLGNPSLTPESSKGFELSLRWRQPRFDASLTAFRQTLSDEIVDVFDPVTFLSSAENGEGKSRRSGVEGELHWQPADFIRLSASYAYLRAREPEVASGQRVETRRPKHSGSIAADAEFGRVSFGAGVAYVGSRFDTNFDVFPSARVRLDDYWLASARMGYDIGHGIEAFVRVSNALDQDYQDVLGYRTEGRSAYAGLRLALGR